MFDRNYSCEIRNTALWKKLFPKIKYSNLQRKYVFLGKIAVDHRLYQNQQ